MVVGYVMLRTQERAAATFARSVAVRYACCDDRRLHAIKEAGVLNGIEYVEVSDSEAPPGARQRTLFVRLLLPVPPG